MKRILPYFVILASFTACEQDAPINIKALNTTQKYNLAGSKWLVDSISISNKPYTKFKREAYQIFESSSQLELKYPDSNESYKHNYTIDGDTLVSNGFDEFSLNKHYIAQLHMDTLVYHIVGSEPIKKIKLKKVRI